MTLRSFILLFSFFLVNPLFSQTNNDKLIYRAIIDYTKEKNEKSIVLQDETETNELRKIEWDVVGGKLYVGGAIGYFQDTTWKDILIIANRFNSPEIMLSNLNGYNFIHLTKDSISRFNERNINKGFVVLSEIFTGVKRVIKFSRVIYSEDKSKAVVYFSRYKNVLNSEGLLYFLIYKNKKWIIAEHVSIWIS